MIYVVVLVEVESLAKGPAIRGFASLAIFRFIDKEASAEHHAAVAVVMMRQLECSPFQFVCLCLIRTILFQNVLCVSKHFSACSTAFGFV